MRHVPRIIAVIAAAAVAAGAPALASAANPPAKVGTTLNLSNGSLGALKQGMSQAKVIGLLGKPDKQASRSLGGKYADLTMSYGRYQLILHFEQGTQGGKPRLSMIDVRAPQYKTNPKGISTGASLTQLKSAFGSRLKCFGAGSGITSPFCTYRSGRGDTLFIVRDKTVTDIQLT
jgi:hypothetical protein